MHNLLFSFFRIFITINNVSYLPGSSKEIFGFSKQSAPECKNRAGLTPARFSRLSKKPRSVCHNSGKSGQNHFLSGRVPDRKYLSGCKCGICTLKAYRLCAQQTAKNWRKSPKVFFDKLGHSIFGVPFVHSKDLPSPAVFQTFYFLHDREKRSGRKTAWVLSLHPWSRICDHPPEEIHGWRTGPGSDGFCRCEAGYGPG